MIGYRISFCGDCWKDAGDKCVFCDLVEKKESEYADEACLDNTDDEFQDEPPSNKFSTDSDDGIDPESNIFAKKSTQKQAVGGKYQGYKLPNSQFCDESSSSVLTSSSSRTKTSLSSVKSAPNSLLSALVGNTSSNLLRPNHGKRTHQNDVLVKKSTTLGQKDHSNPNNDTIAAGYKPCICGLLVVNMLILLSYKTVPLILYNRLCNYCMQVRV